ncbi:hypothetical protein DFJ73DRAFT_626763, partial [Zopfochytrium polystomum]
QLFNTLFTGREVESKVLLDVFPDLAFSDSAIHRGVVIEGLPFAAMNGRDASGDEDLQILESVIKDRPQTFRPVLLHLCIPEHDLIRRRKLQWIDPVTGNLYSGQQVDYSKRKWREGHNEDGIDAEAAEELLAEEETWNFDVAEQVEPAPSENEDDEAEEAEDGEEEKRPPTRGARKVGEPPSFLLSNKKTWAILTEEVLNRLVRRPEDFENGIIQELRSFAKHVEFIAEFCKKHFDEVHVIDLDASQHPDILARNAVNQLEQIGFSSLIKSSAAKKLEIPESGAKAGSEEEFLTLLASSDLEIKEPPRELSSWGRFCPVTFIEEESLIQASLNYPVCYQGLIYFTNSDTYAEKFISNPDKYLSKPPTVPSLHVCVLGGPFTGKSTQSQMIAKIYGLTLLSLDDILQSWDNLPNQSLLLKQNSVYARIVRTCKEGAAISSEEMIDVLQLHLSNFPSTQGWVLDGFPRTVDDAKALVARELVPQNTIILRNDPLEADPLPDAKSQEPELLTSMPSSPITMFPYFDNLYNGFMEEFTGVMQLLESNDSTPVNIAADQSIPTILSVVQKAVDPFLPKAVAISKKQLSELPEKFEFGFTKDYCPFALRQANILKTGSQEFAAKYLSQYYYLSSEEARTAFLMEPHNFVKFRTPIKPPPPRLFFFGPTGSGKSVCMKSLAQWGAPILQFMNVVDEFAKTAEPEVREEIEYMIRENAGLLSPVIVQDIITMLFVQQPYASKGFILEGFPRTKVEAEVLVKHSLHVDAFVVLKIEPEVAAKRIIAERLREAKNRFHSALNLTQKDASSEAARKQLQESERALTQLDDKQAELMDELMDMIEKENMRVQDVISTVEGTGLAPVIEIDCNRCVRPVIRNLKDRLKPYLDFRMSVFSNALAIGESDAETLIRLGIKSFSPFMKTCPVTLSKHRSPLRRPQGKKPVIYREHIFWLRDNDSREEFMANTQAYVHLPPPKNPAPPKICLLGRPKCGKTELSEKLAAEYDIVHLTVPLILESILSERNNGQLANQVTETLGKGEPIPNELVCEAVAMITSRGVCQARGWVLDGFPRSVADMEALEKYNITPHVIVELVQNGAEMMNRQQRTMLADLQSEGTTFNFPEIILENDSLHMLEIGGIRSYYQSVYENWVQVDCTKSKWALKSSLKSIIEANSDRRQNYLYLRTKGYYSLIKIGELVQAPVGTKYTAEYQNSFYRMAGEAELQTFLETPDKYTAGPDLPEDLPIRRDSSVLVFPRQLELQGYCPVTLVEGPPGFDSIVQGDLKYLVEYEGKLFAMESQEKLDKFMRTPWDFSGAVLPKKLPPKVIPIPVSQMPMIGYLEHTVAKALTEGLSAVGRARPKHPFMDLTSSASEYLAIYLKAHNIKAKPWVRKAYETRLRKFEARSSLIQAITAETRGNGYIPPVKRSTGFNLAIDSFFALTPEKYQV